MEIKLVRVGRLELPRTKPLEPKSSASTSSATLAKNCIGREPRIRTVRHHSPYFIDGGFTDHWRESSLLNNWMYLHGLIKSQM